MESKGAINVYTCRECGHEQVTINIENGVTPMFTRCRALGTQCKGTAVSSGYQVDQNRRPEYEWYRPKDAELVKFDRHTREHVKQGGLLLRRARIENLEQLGFGVRL